MHTLFTVLYTPYLWVPCLVWTHTSASLLSLTNLKHNLCLLILCLHSGHLQGSFYSVCVPAKSAALGWLANRTFFLFLCVAQRTGIRCVNNYTIKFPRLDFFTRRARGATLIVRTDLFRQIPD